MSILFPNSKTLEASHHQRMKLVQWAKLSLECFCFSLKLFLLLLPCPGPTSAISAKTSYEIDIFRQKEIVKNHQFNVVQPTIYCSGKGQEVSCLSPFQECPSLYSFVQSFIHSMNIYREPILPHD